MSEQSCAPLREIFRLTTDYGLQRQAADGSLDGVHAHYMILAVWSLCYVTEWAGNTFYRDPSLREAIIRLADYNASHCNERGRFTAQPGGTEAGAWDEWRLYAWLQAMQRLEPELDRDRLELWQAKHAAAGADFLTRCIDMDVFDGNIPNHGIWSHAYVHALGKYLGRADFIEVTAGAFERILGAQTPDGCFPEFQTVVCMPGSPVTGYNRVSAQAINMYFAESGDAAAQAALERAWHWYLDFAFPDGSSPPNLDSRQAYSGRANLACAHFVNQPVGRHFAAAAWARQLAAMASRPGWLTSVHGIGFQALQYPQMQDIVVAAAPSWRPYERMLAEPACIRRRHGWVVSLSGISNRHALNYGIPFFHQERQDAVAIWHEQAGLVIGSAHSLMQPELSTFVFYEHGNARYIWDHAYVKSSPPLDTILLQYGSNIGAASVDTTSASACEVTFSLHGEKGKRPAAGPGHGLSAVGARAHLAARLEQVTALTLGDRSWSLDLADEIRLLLKVAPGARLDFGVYGISCDQPWTFRAPVYSNDPYGPFQDNERLGVIEVVLCNVCSQSASVVRPTATFSITVA